MFLGILLLLLAAYMIYKMITEPISERWEIRFWFIAFGLITLAVASIVDYFNS